MKRCALLPLAALCVAAAPPARGPEGAKPDERGLEGVWSAASYSRDGEVLSAEALKSGRLILRRNEKRDLRPENYSREEFREGKVTVVDSFSAFRVDARAEPRSIDFVLTDPYTGEDTLVYRGIYELKGATLRICRNVHPGGPRPRKFEAGKGSGRVLSAWRRATAPRPPR
jgi:uncharacterized protein (TIGR03067 family)